MLQSSLANNQVRDLQEQGRCNCCAHLWHDSQPPLVAVRQYFGDLLCAFGPKGDSALALILPHPIPVIRSSISNYRSLNR